ncbi:MAG: carboxypeptidase-like regulatory domain-containing protein, partial [Mycobacteriales bacterium]
ETTYTVTRTTSWTSLGQSGDACSGGLGIGVAYQRISVAVTWARMNNIPPVTSDTVVTPPGGQLSPNSITLPVKVVDRNGDAVSDQNVTISPVGGGSSQSQVTDATGCALFAQLTPGLYNVSLDSTGYVDWQGVQGHTQTAGQTAPGTVPVVSIPYDLPGAIVLTVSAVAGFPAPLNPISYTAFHTKWNSPGLRTIAGVGPTSAATLSPAFPFTSDVYNAWAGTCTDSKPASPLVGLVTPGGSSTITPALAPAYVKFQTVGGTTIKLATVTARDTTNGCTDTFILSGLTDASGRLKFSLPYGSWQFKLTLGGVTYNNSAPAINLSQATTTPGGTTTVVMW